MLAEPEALQGLQDTIEDANLTALPESIETGVLDGHFTQISLRMSDGSSLRTGGLVAEEYGPEAFRAVYAAIEQACETAVEEVNDPLPLAPLLLCEYADTQLEYTSDVAFLDQYGTWRTANNIRADISLNGGTHALLLYLSDPENSVPMETIDRDWLESIANAIDKLPDTVFETASTEQITFGLLKRHAFRYDEAGNRTEILLGVEGTERGRMDDPLARALYEWMEQQLPAYTFFGDYFGYSSRTADLDPLIP